MRLKALTIIGIIFMILTTSVAYSYYTAPAYGKKKTPEEVANLFLVALAKYDFETLRTLSTYETNQLIDLMESLGKPDVIPTGPVEKASNCKEQNNKATCDVCCDSEGNNSTIDLYKVDGEWLVHMEKE